MTRLPSYIKLWESGELERRANLATEMLKSCKVCPRNCSIDRTSGEYSFCLSGYLPVVSAYAPHHGEEPVLSGIKGAGNIFFGNCNLRCIFCQNYSISQNWKSEKKNEVSYEKLADIMLELQAKEVHNIGLVSPTHFSPQIIKSIFIAAGKGLKLPVIYNSNGYDSQEIIKMYEGIADIYLPDIKYGNDEFARKYSKVKNYFGTAKEAVKEMYRQVGHELVYEGDVVVRGLIIRHLVLPNDLSETEKVFKFVAEELNPKVHMSVMSQYYPAYKANREILLSRTLRESEYEKILRLMDRYGLENGWTQELESQETYRPAFESSRETPFSF